MEQERSRLEARRSEPERVPGETVQERLAREGPLPGAEAAWIARRLADALAELHARERVHGDVRPAIVRLACDGRLLLEVGDAPDAQAAAFALPERADAARKLGPEADVYGLGAVLFALLAGRPPFEGPPHEVLAAVVSRDAPRLSAVRPGCDARLEELVRRCLAKDPDARPDLRACAALLDLVATAPERPPPARRLALGLALAVIAGVAASLALLAGGRSSPLPVQPPLPPPPVRRAPRPPRPAEPPAPPAPAGDWERIRVIHGDGMARFRAGDYQGAVEMFDRALALAPGSLSTRVDRATSLLKLGRFAEAVVEYGEVITRSEYGGGAYAAQALHGRGVAREALGDPLGAALDYELSIACWSLNRPELPRIQERLSVARARLAGG